MKEKVYGWIFDKKAPEYLRKTELPAKYTTRKNEILIVLFLLGLMAISITELYLGAGIDSVKNQIKYYILGIIIAILIRNKNEFLEKSSMTIIGIAVILLMLLKSPFGMNINGVARCLRLGPVMFFPIYIFMWAYILMFGLALKNTKESLSGKYGSCIRPWGISAISGLLVIIFADQNPMLTYIFVIAMAVSKYILGYKNLHKIGLLIVGLISALGMAIYVNFSYYSYHARRIMAWFHPEDYAKTDAYETMVMFDIVKNMRFLGHRRYDLGYISRMPSAFSDNMFVTVLDELGGLAAILCVICLLALVYNIYNVFKLANKEKNTQGSIVVLGVLVHLLSMAAVNVLISFNFLPKTGAIFPILSATSGNVFYLAEIGMVLYVLKTINKLNAEERVN